MFQTEDKKHYVLNVEAVLNEINPDYLQELYDEEAEEDDIAPQNVEAPHRGPDGKPVYK